MTRIYNHTRYPDALLREILNFSARCAKVSGDVPVKVTYSLHLQPRCEASCSWPYRKTLTGKPTTSKDKRTIKCPIGWIELRIPRDAMRYQKLSNAPEVYRNDSLKAAEWFVDAAIHEMAHVAQFRRRHVPRITATSTATCPASRAGWLTTNGRARSTRRT